MKHRKKISFYSIFVAALLVFASCVSNNEVIEEQKTVVIEPEPVVIEEPKPVKPPAPVKPKKEEEEVIAKFGEVTITKKDYAETKSEIEEIVNELNIITESRNYEKWLKYLSKEYIEHFSNPVTLKETSEKLPVKGVSLKTLEDYFKYVFVPSRNNMRVDDIQYVSPTKVKVIMNPRLLVYQLEQQGNKWKLIP